MRQINAIKAMCFSQRVSTGVLKDYSPSNSQWFGKTVRTKDVPSKTGAAGKDIFEWALFVLPDNVGCVVELKNFWHVVDCGIEDDDGITIDFENVQNSGDKKASTSNKSCAWFEKNFCSKFTPDKSHSLYERIGRRIFKQITAS